MKTAKLFLVVTHRYSYKAGEVAEIIGVTMATPDKSTLPRPCFTLLFKDGTKDSIPIFANEKDWKEKIHTMSSSPRRMSRRVAFQKFATNCILDNSDTESREKYFSRLSPFLKSKNEL